PSPRRRARRTPWREARRGHALGAGQDAAWRASLRVARLKRRKLSHDDPVDRDPSATVSTNVGEQMQRGALLLAAGGALSPSFAPVTLSVTCPCEPAANNTPPAKVGAELHHGRPLAGRPRGGIARCSLRRKICPPPVNLTRCSNLACKLLLRRWRSRRFRQAPPLRTRKRRSLRSRI